MDKEIKHQFICILRRIKLSDPKDATCGWEIPENVDIDKVKIDFLLWLLDDPDDGLKRYVSGNSLIVVQHVIDTYRKMSQGETVTPLAFKLLQAACEVVTREESEKRVEPDTASIQELVCLIGWDAAEGLDKVFNCLDKAWNVHSLSKEYATKQGNELQRLCELHQLEKVKA